MVILVHFMLFPTFDALILHFYSIPCVHVPIQVLNGTIWTNPFGCSTHKQFSTDAIYVSWYVVMFTMSVICLVLNYRHTCMREIFYCACASWSAAHSNLAIFFF